MIKPASGASMTQDSYRIQVKWLAHSSHITGGDQDIDSVDLETLSSTIDSFQERTFEGGSALSQKALFVPKRRVYISDLLYRGSSLRIRGSNY